MLDVCIDQKSFDTANGEVLKAIEGLQFQVPAGSFTCVVGPSGCGKTSTLRVILGLDTDYQGTVSIAGRGRVAAVFQEPRLLPWRTVEQNVLLCLPVEVGESQIQDLYQELGLQDLLQFYPTELSLGLARRVALARAFALEPELLILDEPFVSLDDDTAGRLRKLLMAVWCARPTTALMVTHNLREAVELADNVLLLSERPTRVVADVDISTPREERSEAVISNYVRQLDDLRHAPL